MLIDRYTISGFNRFNQQMESIQSYQFDRAKLDDMESRSEIFSNFVRYVAAAALLDGGKYIDANVTLVSTYDTDEGKFIFDITKKHAGQSV